MSHPKALFITLVLLALVIDCTLIYSADTAIDWGPSGYNFPTQAAAPSNYNEVRQNIRLRVTRRSADDLSVEPNTLYSITSGSPPIINSSPLPSVEITGTANAGNPRMLVRIISATASDTVVAPGQYFFIGGLTIDAATNLIVDQVRFSQVGGGLIQANLMVPSNFDVNTTDTTNLTWNTSGNTGNITFPAGTGRSGVLFLKNTSGVALDLITFRIRHDLATSLYFGTTTPEPSMYLTLAGGVLVIGFLAKRRQKRKLRQA